MSEGRISSKLWLFFKHCRPKNLVIVGITQCAVYGLILWPILFQNNDGESTLSLAQLGLLILDTIILAAGGYIINDIVDDPIDRINKGAASSIILNLGASFATVGYWSLGIIGLVIAAYLAQVTGLWNLFWLFPLSWVLLLLYARVFKKTPLFGNLIVSLFCAFVPGILLVAEWPKLYSLAYAEVALKHVVGLTVLLLYILFAFLATMIREIIKDMEDKEGDEQFGCRTLPIVWGIEKTKIVIYLFSIMLLYTLFYFGLSLVKNGWWISAAWIMLGVILPFLVLLIRLNKAKQKENFHQLSQGMKYIMLFGLLLLLVIRIEVL